MSYERPVVLSIAGYDPSGGAGVLADIKTFEQLQCLGMAAVTAWTVQTEDSFCHLEPMATAQIRAQVTPLLDRYPIRWIKLGLFSQAEDLLVLLRWLKEQDPDLRIIWDPVLSASAGYSFAHGIGREVIPEIAKHIYLITPNVPEAKSLTGLHDEQEAAVWLAEYSNVLLKGGHSTVAPGTDYLYYAGGIMQICPSAAEAWPKHGSGCILSAAVTALLAKGKGLEQACIEAKQYIEQVLRSNTQLLAYHVT
jgi:hydroxymethylpyrimidine/phosphomethylpyrimidine kinase